MPESLSQATDFDWIQQTQLKDDQHRDAVWHDFQKERSDSVLWISVKSVTLPVGFRGTVTADCCLLGNSLTISVCQDVFQLPKRHCGVFLLRLPQTMPTSCSVFLRGSARWLRREGCQAWQRESWDPHGGRQDWLLQAVFWPPRKHTILKCLRK